MMFYAGGRECLQMHMQDCYQVLLLGYDNFCSSQMIPLHTLNVNDSYS